MKTPRQLERYFKGAANHWRIAILWMVERKGGLSVQQLTDELRGQFKNISQHTRFLVQAGLLNKAHRGRRVVHALSPYGRRFVAFMRTF